MLPLLHWECTDVMDDARTASIRALVEPILEAQDTELVELTCRPQGGVLIVRCLIDKVGGVTVQDCARVSRLIDEALEGSGLIEQSYTLEVSSPGLDRPLRNHRDYERAVGEELSLSIQTASGGLQESQGQLLAVQPEAIVLKTSSGNVTIPLSDIHSAKKAITL